MFQSTPNNSETKLSKIFTVVFNIKLSQVKKSNFNNVKKWDSLAHLNLILAIETTFKIKIDPEDSINFTSYKNIYAYLKKNSKVNFH